MYPVKHGWFRKKKLERGLATICQFASAMGLHPDFHKISWAPIRLILDKLQTKFQVDPEDPNYPTYHCGGILVIEDQPQKMVILTDDFTDDILEILTEDPQFAFVQFVFQSIKLPKEFQTEKEEDKRRLSRVHFDIQKGKVERRFNPLNTNIMEEAGCFEFSPRILVVETNLNTLKTKLDRLSVLFVSKGFKIRLYPTFRRRFSYFINICTLRKIVSPIILDGYSLMSFISPPQRQFSHEGYILVPNKNSYALSTGVNKVITPNAINIGIPIISGKTANVPLLLEGKVLNRHMAVFGMTGEGKSRFIYGLIREFYQKKTNFLIFDPKGEYLHPIKSICSDFVYLKPGSASFPWGINIFQLPQNKEGEDIVPIEDHIQFVVSILDHIFDETEGVSPQMRRLLHLAVIKTVEECGDFRTFLSWINRHKDLNIQGSYLENTAAGIINRIEKLFFGNTGRCFTVKQTTFELAKLLERNTIIDLSAFEAMEDQKGRQIFLDVVFQFLYYFLRSSRAPFKEEGLPKNIIVLDEIQKLIPMKNYRSRTPTSMIGLGPWTLRAYDVSMIFVGTDPIVDQPMLSNTGVLTVFFTNFDPYAMANLLGISKHEYEQLRSLLKAKPDERYCIVSTNGKASLLKTNEFTFDLQSSLDLDTLQNLPFQKRIRESYQASVFNPIKEILTKK